MHWIGLLHIIISLAVDGNHGTFPVVCFFLFFFIFLILGVLKYIWWQNFMICQMYAICSVTLTYILHKRIYTENSAQDNTWIIIIINYPLISWIFPLFTLNGIQMDIMHQWNLLTHELCLWQLLFTTKQHMKLMPVIAHPYSKYIWVYSVHYVAYISNGNLYFTIFLM